MASILSISHYLHTYSLLATNLINISGSIFKHVKIMNTFTCEEFSEFINMSVIGSKQFLNSELFKKVVAN